ncbi:zinc finger and BTB domain-containing protein 21-like [Arapaima gigas]
MSTLNEQRVSGHLCDVTLIVADQKFHAHRSVLAASSEYFQALFTRTHSDVQAVVHLDFCEANVFENVLNYIYSSSLFVSKESLAAIQELGYSLGISFLTTIMTKKPPVSYSVSRKTLFIEDKDSVVDQNTVKPDESFPHVKLLYSSRRQTLQKASWNEGQKVLLCQEQVKVKEEQCEEAVDKRMPPDNVRIAESTLWSCEKCGKVFSAIRELEHHQELLCYVKPFICHICHKSFRTKFRLWSHIQSHTSNPDASRLGGKGQQPSSLSPSLLLLAAKVEDVPVAVPKSTERDCRAAEPPCRTQQANARLSPGAPALSAHAFHSQYVCKSCCRTFKSAFSLWSHEQSRSCC